MRVATVDDDIALLDAGLEESLDESIDSLASLNEHHHSSWLLELRDELLDAVRANDGLALGLILQEAVHLLDCAVEGDNGEAVVSHVQDQILTHDGQANEAEVSSGAASC